MNPKVYTKPAPSSTRTKHFADDAHRIRSILNDKKVDTRSKLFNFVSLDAHRGTSTADLFAEEGDGYAG